MEKIDVDKLPTWLYIEKWDAGHPYYNVHWGDLNNIRYLSN
jgi:hypothetical protein